MAKKEIIEAVPVDKSLDLTKCKSASATLVRNNPAAVVSAAKGVLDSIFEYLKTRDEQQTRRQAIDAQREVAIERIRAQKDILMEAMRLVFAERAKILEKSFEALDKGLAEGRDSVVHDSLNTIAEVVKSSPFKSIGELQMMLKDPNSVLMLE